MKKVVKKVEGTKVKTYRGCQIYLNKGKYEVHYKGEIFPCKSIDFAVTLIDTWKDK